MSLGYLNKYKTIRALNDGEIVEVEGIKFRKINGEINPGDFYIAERNTGPQLLTCKRVDYNACYIIPQENAYPFDCDECVKVEIVE